MDFSIIIPTRNRSAQLATALQSVLVQTHPSYEVIIVDDGSDEEQRSAIRQLAERHAERFVVVELPRRALGHGPSFARNTGITRARGKYLGFLDDDDWWTDPEHLSRAHRCLSTGTTEIDLLLSNQAAYQSDTRLSEVIWLESLEARLKATALPDGDGCYQVSVSDLVAHGKFCHLNTTIISRSLCDAIGGFDESMRYEEDVDFYLRAIQKARSVKHCPAFISRHNIPDRSRQDNASTILSSIDKQLMQLRWMDKAILRSEREDVRRFAMRMKRWTLMRVSNTCSLANKRDAARSYAWEAFGIGLALWWQSTPILATLRRAWRG